MTDKYELAPWMKVAESYLGQKEISGSKHNPVIVKFFAEAGHPEIKNDDTAWCSAFTNAVMYESGWQGTKNLLARSWLKWINGDSVSTPRFGDIVIFSRGSDPTFGHVAFFERWDDNWVYVLGGNQGRVGAVTRTRISRSKLLGFRRPKAKPTPATKLPEISQVEKPKVSPEEVIIGTTTTVASGYQLVNGEAVFGAVLMLTFMLTMVYIIWKRSR